MKIHLWLNKFQSPVGLETLTPRSAGQRLISELSGLLSEIEVLFRTGNTNFPTCAVD